MRTAPVLLALVVGGALLLGCSKSDGGAPPTTTAAATSEPDTAVQQAAMDGAEDVLSTIRIPGAVGVFSETVQACVSTQFPQATRADRSSLPPAELTAQLAEALEADGWSHDEPTGEGDPDTYWKDPYQLSVEIVPADDGGTKATLEVSAPKTNCA